MLIQTITTSFGKKFSQSVGETILEAAVLNGINLPYSCTTGRCSSCKCKILHGESTARSEETGLSEEEKSQGWILTCVRYAITDIVIDLEDLSEVSIPVIKTFPARINNIEKLAPDVLGVKLRLPPSCNVGHIAGQFINVMSPAGQVRSYSLANAPAEDNLLELHIRLVSGGIMSDYWLNQAKVNDLVRIKGPMGSFFLRKLSGRHLIFLATGTGVAPIKAMLESLKSYGPEEEPQSITLYWGARNKQDLYCDPTQWHKQLNYHSVLSRAASDYKGLSGHVQDALMSREPDLKNSVVYACGSDLMIRNAKNALIQAGLPSTNFYADAFVCSASN